MVSISRLTGNLSNPGYDLMGGSSSGSGGGPPASGPILPVGADNPVAWFSARDVELDGSNEVTKILNQGSTGSVNDATPIRSNKVNVTQPVSWAGRDVFDITSDAGYSFGNIAEARTIIAITTYKDGVDATFDDFDGLVSDEVGSSIELTGSSGSNEWFFNFVYFKNGVNLGASKAVLPLNKDTVAATNAAAAFSAVGTLFEDQGFPSRSWRGLVGDIVIYQGVLSDTLIADVQSALSSWYA